MEIVISPTSIPTNIPSLSHESSTGENNHPIVVPTHIPKLLNLHHDDGVRCIVHACSYEVYMNPSIHKPIYMILYVCHHHTVFNIYIQLGIYETFFWATKMGFNNISSPFFILYDSSHFISIVTYIPDGEMCPQARAASAWAGDLSASALALRWWPSFRCLVVGWSTAGEGLRMDIGRPKGWMLHFMDFHGKYHLQMDDH